MRRQPKGSLKVFAKVALQYLYLQIGLLDSFTLESLNAGLTSSHTYAGYKVLSILGTGLGSVQIKRLIDVLGIFFSTYFWKDYTFLALDTQKEFKTFCQNLKAVSGGDQRFSNAYCDLLVFSEEGLFDEEAIIQLQDEEPSMSSKEPPRMVGSMKVTISVLIFKTYLYELHLLADSLLRSQEPQTQAQGEELSTKKKKTPQQIKELFETLEKKLGRTTRFVKYVLSLLELTANSKQRRKEIVLRAHFDFFYLAYLSFLFGLEARSDESTEVCQLVRAHILQTLTFLLVLVEVTDSKFKNFTTIVKMKRQRFSVQCDSLAYKMAMEFLLSDDKPIWELEAFDFKKVGVRYQPGPVHWLQLGKRSCFKCKRLHSQLQDQKTSGKTVPPRLRKVSQTCPKET